MTSEPGMTFWDWSMAFHGLPGVGAACIALQDEHGADVDMLLFALWSGSRGCRVTEAEMERLDALVAPWRAGVIQPIRAARRALKPAPEGFAAERAAALRQQLLAAELDAERVQQDTMEAAAPAPGAAQARAAGRENLACYATLAGIPARVPSLDLLLEAFVP